MELMDPRVDFVFKSIFGTEKNLDILIDFVNAVFTDAGQQRVTSLTLMNPFTLKEAASDKLGILDIKARTESGIMIDVEIQVQNHHDMAARSLYYAARLVTEQVHSGSPYTTLRKTVTINIVDFKLLPTNLDHTVFHLWDDTNMITLTELLEMHFLELPKLNDTVPLGQRQLARWMRFLTTTSQQRMEELAVDNVAVEKALKELEHLSQDPEARALYESRLKGITDYITDVTAARTEERTRIIRALLAHGMDPRHVAELLDLQEDEVDRIRNNPN